MFAYLSSAGCAALRWIHNRTHSNRDSPEPQTICKEYFFLKKSSLRVIPSLQRRRHFSLAKKLSPISLGLISFCQKKFLPQAPVSYLDTRVPFNVSGQHTEDESVLTNWCLPTVVSPWYCCPFTHRPVAVFSYTLRVREDCNPPWLEFQQEKVQHSLISLWITHPANESCFYSVSPSRQENVRLISLSSLRSLFLNNKTWGPHLHKWHRYELSRSSGPSESRHACADRFVSRLFGVSVKCTINVFQFINTINIVFCLRTGVVCTNIKHAEEFNSVFKTGSWDG